MISTVAHVGEVPELDTPGLRPRFLLPKKDARQPSVVLSSMMVFNFFGLAPIRITTVFFELGF